MPWSGGVYTRGYASWVTDANNALPISASKFDTEDNDFASGLNNCLTIDGLNKPTSTLNWAVQMNWTRGTDGNLWSLARTGGANNPKVQASVLDASGMTFAITGGGWTQTSTGAMALTASAGGLALTATAGGLTATATAGTMALLASAGAITLNGTALQGQGPVAAALVDMTPDKSSWTTALSGPWVAGNNPTGTLKWERQGTQVTIWCDTAITQTATVATTLTASGLPAAITPSSNRVVTCENLEDNSVSQCMGLVTVSTSNTLVFQPLFSSGSRILSTTFVGIGTTGIMAGWSITYSL